MNYKLVLVERVAKTGNNIVASSGLLFGDFVIVTSNVFADKPFTKCNLTEVNGNIHLNPFESESINLTCVLHVNDNTYEVKTATVFAVFCSESIKKSGRFLKNFAIDAMDNNTKLDEIISTFFILTINSKSTVEDLRHSLKLWWDFIGRFNIKKCDEVFIDSCAFANRNFLNSISQGIVSNILGENCCFILSDCPSTPGSEGSPVFIGESGANLACPIGIVLSSVSFWRGEWTGLTITADLRNIIIELIDPYPRNTYPPHKEIPNHLVVANCEFSLVQIYSGINWGTAILLDSQRGIFITNSHVVVEEETNLFYKGTKFPAKALFQTSCNSGYDLAIIECKSILTQKLKSISVSKKECVLGQLVYSASFPLIPKEFHPTPTLTKGCVSKSDKFMLKTTCSIHAGSSGGAILDENGFLVGIIVSNTKLNDKNSIFPRMNMAIPYIVISNIIERYIKENDVQILKDLEITSREMKDIWNLEAKL